MTLPVRLTLALACLLLAACGSTPTTTTSATASGAGASASATSAPAGSGEVVVPLAGSPPLAGHPWFLAVGDSITSGFTIDQSRAGVNSAWPLQLQALLATRGEPWSLYDVACPGETMASYTSGCHDRLVRTELGGKPQRDLALAAITAHLADLKLILVDLGSNDLLRTLRGGGDQAAAAAALRTSLTATVAELRAAAPGVPLVLANYYNPLANLIPTTEASLVPVNAVVAAVAHAQGVTLVDFHAAINTQPPPDSTLCQWVDCAHIDIHPTVAGHQRLARAALAVVP